MPQDILNSYSEYIHNHNRFPMKVIIPLIRMRYPPATREDKNPSPYLCFNCDLWNKRKEAEGANVIEYISMGTVLSYDEWEKRAAFTKKAQLDGKIRISDLKNLI